MATKLKGIRKGFKFFISNIFVVKERELEIGYPTDVKHVAHIGWGGQSDSAPSWMKEYTTVSDFSTASLNNLGGSRDSNGVGVPSWSTRGFEQSLGSQQTSEIYKNSSQAARSKPSKKQKRKKIKSPASSPRSSSSTARASRAATSKAFAKAVSNLGTTQSLQIL